MRIRLDLAYDGTDFRGWAAQPGLRTVAGRAVGRAGDGAAGRRRSPLTCAGRTDAGVHARGQVVHVDLDELPEGPERLAAPAQRHPRRPTCGCAGWSRRPTGFDARFAALWRRYAYRIADDPACVDPLARGARAGLAAAARRGGR